MGPAAIDVGKFCIAVISLRIIVILIEFHVLCLHRLHVLTWASFLDVNSLELWFELSILTKLLVPGWQPLRGPTITVRILGSCSLVFDRYT
jgi:hypothetical protein